MRSSLQILPPGHRRFSQLSDSLQYHWYFCCLAITYDKDNTAKRKFMHYDRSSLMMTLTRANQGIYYKWLAECETKFGYFTQWIQDKQAAYLEVTETRNFSSLGSDYQHRHISRFISQNRFCEALATMGSQDGYMQLLSETYEKSLIGLKEIDKGKAFFILIQKEQHKKQLIYEVKKAQRELEVELRRINPIALEELNEESKETVPTPPREIQDFNSLISSPLIRAQNFPALPRRLMTTRKREQVQERPPLSIFSQGIGEMCTICQDAFKPGDKTLDLKVCDHLYHTECISQWLKKQRICPLCQREVP